MLLPRLLLFRGSRGGLIPTPTLLERFAKFSQGLWTNMLSCSQHAEDAASTRSRRQSRGAPPDNLTDRVARASACVQLGELSSGRDALEVAALAPGTAETLFVLSDPSRRPPTTVHQIPANVLGHRPTHMFELRHDRVSSNIRNAKCGTAGCPSGLTSNHLRPVLTTTLDTQLLFLMTDDLANTHLPEPIISAIRLGWLTALTNKGGGVRGIIAGDVFRRLVARTVSQQLSEPVKQATSPHQYALSTHAGYECIAICYRPLLI